MEKSKGEQTSPFEEGFWSSSGEESFPNNLHRQLISTPNVSVWPMLSQNLESSGSLSKTDSGYCSLTPLSTDSLGRVIGKKCCFCRTNIHVHSTPNCTCQKSYSCENKSLPLECMGTISDPRTPFEHPILTSNKARSSLNFYDDAMDTSLYEADVQQSASTNTQECILCPMEIGEEKSVDFTDSGISLPNTSELYKKFINEEQDNGFESDEFFSPETNMLAFNISSPKKRDETPTKKTKTDNTFRSVAKNICNINIFLRSFTLNGFEEVDFLYQLGVKRNFPHIITKIFDLLSDKDLDSVRVVSKTWNKIFLNDVKTHSRWKLYKTDTKMRIENCYSPVKKRGSEGRLTLVNITNQNSPNKDNSPSHSPPVSPQSVRFRSYQKAAQNLKQGERLLRCPKCQFPSHDKGSPNAQCSRSGCRHRFCVWCRYETTPEAQHNCPPLFTPLSRDCRSTPRIHRVGSKHSKRNLRRL